MATLGTLGDIVFSVSDKKIQTFRDMSLESSVKYYTHDRHLQKPLLEFGGMESDKLSFSMYHSAFLGVDPKRQVETVDKYMKEGEILSLVIDGARYGSKWVITKHSKDYKVFGQNGELLVVESKVTLEEYASR